MSGRGGKLVYKILQKHPFLKKLIKKILSSGLPVPGLLLPLIRSLYQGGVVVAEALRFIYSWFVVSPVMRAISYRMGKNVRIERIPFIRGPGRITIGDNVYISGKLGVAFSCNGSGNSMLHIGNGTFIGHGTSFSIADQIIIGDECLIAGNVTIQDNDGHPLNPKQRRAGQPVPRKDIKPVTVENGAWIGRGATILKGVRIGENAVIGASSVVTKDIPANSVACGSPAKVIKTL
ncbi:DapH/DapD/GlmU-related protein [Thiolapillus sp.]